MKIEFVNKAPNPKCIKDAILHNTDTGMVLLPVEYGCKYVVLSGGTTARDKFSLLSTQVLELEHYDFSKPNWTVYTGKVILESGCS